MVKSSELHTYCIQEKKDMLKCLSKLSLGTKIYKDRENQIFVPRFSQPHKN
jgi:hypothetical protein